MPCGVQSRPVQSLVGGFVDAARLGAAVEHIRVGGGLIDAIHICLPGHLYLAGDRAERFVGSEVCPYRGVVALGGIPLFEPGFLLLQLQGQGRFFYAAPPFFVVLGMRRFDEVVCGVPGPVGRVDRVDIRVFGVHEQGPGGRVGVDFRLEAQGLLGGQGEAQAEEAGEEKGMAHRYLFGG